MERKMKQSNKTNHRKLCFSRNKKLSCQKATRFNDFMAHLYPHPQMFTFPNFIKGCKSGHSYVAKRIIENNKLNVVQVSSTTIQGETYNGIFPLWLAAAAGKLNIVKLLVKYDASINRSTERHSTPLWIACHEGHFAVARYLIQQGADLEATNPAGFTCLMISCQKACSLLGRYLIKCGADVNRQDVEGNTALHICAMRGHLRILKFLLESGAELSCNSDGLTPLLCAATCTREEVVEFFIQEYCCAKLDKINALELLGANYADRNGDLDKALAFWKQALLLRFEGNDHPIRKLTTQSLLSSYVNVTEFCTFAELNELNSLDAGLQAVLIRERVLGPAHASTLKFAHLRGVMYAVHGDCDKSFLILMYCLDVRQKYLQPLSNRTQDTLSTFRHFLGISKLRYLFQMEPVTLKDITCNVFEKSVLEIKSGMEWLKKHGENLIYTNQFHRILILTLELMSLACGLEMDMNEELQFKRNVYQLVHMDPRGQNCRSVLHLACSDESSHELFKFPTSAMIDLLLEVGASPNAVDISNNTPLHILATIRPFHHQAIFKSFLKHGAHLDLCNDERQTPLQLAQDFLLDIDPLQFVNLQCLSARVIRMHNIPYQGIIGERLEAFLNGH